MVIFTQFRRLVFLTLLVSIIAPCAFAADLRVAVASNFVLTIKALGPRFTEQTGHSLSISSASSGKHFAQIKNGAPFDLFLAADSTRPALLEQQGYAVQDTRVTYALGKLVLWSAVLEQLPPDVLGDAGYRRLAIANPRHAPYGLATKQALHAMGLWPLVKSKLLRGENVTQAFQFVATENAELGFASLAQIRHFKENGLFSGSYWLVPSDLYDPIEQQALVLRDSKAARQFIEFIQSDAVRKIIRDHGYDTL